MTSDSARRLSRRRFLKIAGLGTLGTAVFSGAGYYYVTQLEPADVEVTRHTLRLPRLDPAFDGFTIAHISDFHFDDGWMTLDRMRGYLAILTRQGADAVAMTGDYVTDQARPYHDAMVQSFGLIAEHHPVAIGVLGNHDHWTNPRRIRDIWAQVGVEDLSNRVLTLERGGAQLHLCGVDDHSEEKDRLEDVLAELPDTGAAVLLVHEPDFADVSAATGRFDLQLAGHSHGGQVRLPLFGPLKLPIYGRKYPAGSYRVGNMIQYTNRGLGMIAPYIRFNCRPEITLLTLRSLRV